MDPAPVEVGSLSHDWLVLYIPGGCLGLGMERSWKIQRKELMN